MLKKNHLLATGIAAAAVFFSTLAPSAIAADRVTTTTHRTVTVQQQRGPVVDDQDAYQLRDQMRRSLDELSSQLRQLHQNFWVSGRRTPSGSAWTASSGTPPQGYAAAYRAPVVLHPGGIVYEAPSVRNRQPAVTLPDGMIVVPDRH